MKKFISKRKPELLNLTRGSVLLALSLFTGAASAVTGAAFTTTNTGVDGTGHCKNGNEAINCNIYDGKQYVWLSGGPLQAAVGDGRYFFAVLVPGGQNEPNDAGALNLSDTVATPPTGSGDVYTNRIFEISGGTITYGGSHSFDNNKIRLMPYDDTTNPGGVYILAICRLGDAGGTDTQPVSPASCKYDAFKAADAGGPIPTTGRLSGKKYYDANTDGIWQSTEPGIPNWPITITDSSLFTYLKVTDLDGNFIENDLFTDNYTIVEQVANTPWQQTGNLTNQTTHTPNNTLISLSNFVYQVSVNGGSTTGLYFGNICLGGGGGKTLGFWSNKNGQSLFGADDLALMTSSNLRNAAGAHFDPANYTAFRSWLLGANATNMAYMLSAQLAAMELNVLNSQVSGGALIYAPGTNSANANGFATVNSVMTEANTELGTNGLTSSGHPSRMYQEYLKNALDNANNNRTFVQSGPEKCPLPVFP